MRFITRAEEELDKIGRYIVLSIFIGLVSFCMVGVMLRSVPLTSFMGVAFMITFFPMGVGFLSVWLVKSRGQKAVEKRNEIMNYGRPLLGYVKNIKEVYTGGKHRVKCLRYTIVYDLENGEGQKEWKSELYMYHNIGVIRENSFCKIHVYGDEVCMDEDQTREIPVFGESSNNWRHY